MRFVAEKNLPKGIFLIPFVIAIRYIPEES
jgi:hypothetical protein